MRSNCYRSARGPAIRATWPFLAWEKRASCRTLPEAERDFASVTDIVPAYYGGWLKRAESLLALGRREEARECPKGRERLTRTISGYGIFGSF